MAVINTNVMSLNTQRNLGSSQGMLQTAMQRLSSGLRINSAKDDAAGLAISGVISCWSWATSFCSEARSVAELVSLADWTASSRMRCSALVTSPRAPSAV